MAGKVEVLVIGGGVIGVCSAHALAARGLGVTLVEKGEIGGGCSYGNAGFICPGYALPLAMPGVIGRALRWLLDRDGPLHIEPRLDLELLRWLWRFRAACNDEVVRRVVGVIRTLGQHSLSAYQAFAERGGLSFGYAQHGWVFLCNTSEGLDHGLAESRLLGEFGVSSEVLDRDALSRKVPGLLPSVIGGIHYRGDASLIPDRFVGELARVTTARGASVRPFTEVLAIDVSGRRITSVVTTRGSFAPEQVVLAAGSWSPLLGRQLGLRIPIQPAKGYSVTVNRFAGDPPLPCYLSEKKVTVTPMGDRIRFTGTLELAGFDLSVNLRRTAAISTAGRSYFASAPDDWGDVEIWRGLRPATPDGLPIVGRSDALDNLILATGHGMMGMTLGPATGELVAQIVCREPPGLDGSALSPGRFAL